MADPRNTDPASHYTQNCQLINKRSRSFPTNLNCHAEEKKNVNTFNG